MTDGHPADRPPDRSRPVLWDRTRGTSRPTTLAPGTILKLLARGRRSVGLYGVAHPVAVENLRDLQSGLEGLLAGRKFLKILVHEDTFFADNTVLLEESLQLFSLLQAITARKISGVQVDNGIEVDELGHFVTLLNLEAEELNRAGGAVKYLEGKGVRHIKLATLTAGAEPRTGGVRRSREGLQSRETEVSAGTRRAAEGKLEAGKAAGAGHTAESAESASIPAEAPAASEKPRVDPSDAYGAGLRMMDELTYQAAEGVPLDMQRASLLINSFINIMHQDRAALLRLTALKQYDEDTYHHSVNVSILSLLIGEELGLDRSVLTVVALAGLLHDVGKARVPQEILRKPGTLSAEEQETVRRHPLYGAQALRDLPGLNALAMVVAFEHHANFDLSGYPKITAKKVPHLVTRIVHVADVFDAATSSRRKYRRGKAGSEAIHLILEGMGTIFDPVPAALLARVLARWGPEQVGGQAMSSDPTKGAGDLEPNAPLT